MTENLYTKNSIRTFTGIYFNVLEPTEAMINIEDIAHALSHLCRFNGHLPKFYSVGQHSYIVAGLCSPERQLEALLHDASEAYLCDVPKPVKPLLTNYKEIEDKLMALIAKKFGFQWPLSEEVHAADQNMLQLEWDHLMLANNEEIKIYKPSEVKKMFLDKFYELTSVKTA